MKGDLELKEKVVEELNWDPALDATEIGVQVKDGVITLTGRLANHAARCAAEQAVRRVPGVMAIAVEIDVRLPDEHRRTNADIARAAANVLAWTSVLPADRVAVTVENGAVMLTGNVDWHYQRMAAERAVACLYGVVKVVNAIGVQPTPVASDIRDRIAAAIERQARDDAAHISVDIENDEVILRGSVRTWAERDTASEAAWAAPGIGSVSNRIRVDL